MKKKIFKSLAVVACALLLVVGSVVGTFAYLTSTKTIKNTFTVGNVTIELTEAKVDEKGEIINPTVRWTEGNTYHIVPDGEYDKDPQVTVKANSDSCYVFVKVINGLATIEEADEGDITIEDQLEANNWLPLAGVDNVYVYTGSAVAKSNADQTIPVFTEIIIDDNVTNEALSALTNKTVVVTAYAVQSAGFANAEAAWTATFGKPANNN